VPQHQASMQPWGDAGEQSDAAAEAVLNEDLLSLR
jgi:hypothetical protein